MTRFGPGSPPENPAYESDHDRYWRSIRRTLDEVAMEPGGPLGSASVPERDALTERIVRGLLDAAREEP